MFAVLWQSIMDSDVKKFCCGKQVAVVSGCHVERFGGVLVRTDAKLTIDLASGVKSLILTAKAIVTVANKVVRCLA